MVPSASGCQSFYIGDDEGITGNNVCASEASIVNGNYSASGFSQETAIGEGVATIGQVEDYCKIGNLDDEEEGGEQVSCSDGDVQNPHGMSPSLNLTRHYPACVFTHFGGDPDVTFEPLFGPDLDSLGPPATFLGHQLHAAFKTNCTQANVHEFIHPEKAPRARRPR